MARSLSNEDKKREIEKSNADHQKGNEEKKNTKTVVTKQIAILKEEFLHGITHSACDWKDICQSAVGEYTVLEINKGRFSVGLE